MSSSPHDQAQLMIGHLAEIGPRRAGSPQEATAAAFINARLRRAGMGVTTHPLHVTSRRRRLYGAAAASGLFAALTAIMLPAPALALALAAITILLLDAAIGPLIHVGPRHTSQTIVGTQAISGGAPGSPRLPRWRVVILAPLDSSMLTPGISALAGPARSAALARLAALILVALAVLIDQQRPAHGWVLLVIPATILLALQIAAVLRGPRPARSDGSAGALTAMLLAAQRLHDLRQVEVWAAAVGASALDPGGIEDLLRSYPFERPQTLIIALEHLAGGTLCYRAGGGRSDQEGGRLIAAAAQSLNMSIAERAPAGHLALAAPLRRRGMRALALYSHGPTRAGPRRADPQLCEDAARLIAAIIEQLEAQSVREAQ